MKNTRQIMNLEDIESLLNERMDELNYISVSERLNGNSEQQLCRLSFESLPPNESTPSTWGGKVEEALGRLRRELLGMAYEENTSFRVSVYGAGSLRLMQRTCVVLERVAETEEAEAEVKAVKKVSGNGAYPFGSAWQDFTSTVMAQTEQFGALCQEQMKAVDKVSRGQAEHFSRETAAAREQVTTLVDKLTTARMEEAELNAELLTTSKDVAPDAERTQANQALARDAIGKLGELGQAFLASKTNLPEKD